MQQGRRPASRSTGFYVAASAHGKSPGHSPAQRSAHEEFYRGTQQVVVSTREPHGCIEMGSPAVFACRTTTEVLVGLQRRLPKQRTRIRFYRKIGQRTGSYPIRNSSPVRQSG